jgi:hypothetical protein
MKRVSSLKGLFPKLASTDLPARDNLEARVAVEPVWYIRSPEGSLAAYDSDPADTARVVQEAIDNGVFNDALAGLPAIDA